MDQKLLKASTLAAKWSLSPYVQGSSTSRDVKVIKWELGHLLLEGVGREPLPGALSYLWSPNIAFIGTWTNLSLEFRTKKNERTSTIRKVSFILLKD